MNKLEQEINPLDISFSNDKGFEPSTPSQTSPPTKLQSKIANIHIRNPFELFEVHNSKTIYPQRQFTPPSRADRIDIGKIFTSTKKEVNKQIVPRQKNRMTQSIEMANLQQKKKKDLLKWQSIQISHIREISRIDSLLNRVQKNISLYSKLYPKKRY